MKLPVGKPLLFITSLLLLIEAAKGDEPVSRAMPVRAVATELEKALTGYVNEYSIHAVREPKTDSIIKLSLSHINMLAGEQNEINPRGIHFLPDSVVDQWKRHDKRGSEFFLLWDGNWDRRIRLGELDIPNHSVLVVAREPLAERQHKAEQDGAGQPATAQDSRTEGDEKPNPESEVRSQ